MHKVPRQRGRRETPVERIMKVEEMRKERWEEGKCCNFYVYLFEYIM